MGPDANDQDLDRFQRTRDLIMGPLYELSVEYHEIDPDLSTDEKKRKQEEIQVQMINRICDHEDTLTALMRWATNAAANNNVRIRRRKALENNTPGGYFRYIAGVENQKDLVFERYEFGQQFVLELFERGHQQFFERPLENPEEAYQHYQGCVCRAFDRAMDHLIGKHFDQNKVHQHGSDQDQAEWLESLLGKNAELNSHYDPHYSDADVADEGENFHEFIYQRLLEWAKENHRRAGRRTPGEQVCLQRACALWRHLILKERAIDICRVNERYLGQYRNDRLSADKGDFIEFCSSNIPEKGLSIGEPPEWYKSRGGLMPEDELEPRPRIVEKELES